MTLVRCPGSHAERFTDGVVVYLPDRGTVHLLDTTAADLWDALDGADVAEVAVAVAAAAADTSEDVAAEVRRLADQLLCLGLLQVEARPASGGADGDDEL